MVGEIILAYRRLAQRRIGSFARCRAVLSQRGFEAFDQGLPVEWFAQEAGCSRLSPVAVALDGKGRAEMREGPPWLASGLQIEPAHVRHSDSVITHDVSLRWGDRRKYAAEANVWTR